jgi:flavin reductase (DIM6/NTAB) family NADH-FMN oxidoreductase RutF
MHAKEPGDPRDLRMAFGRFGTGVTIVTTLAQDGSRVGLTANSFNTVSLEPPIVVWSLSSKSVSLPAFQSAGRFVVNVLSQEQLPLSQRFSKNVPDRFAGADVQQGLGGLPLLKGSAAVFECRTIMERLLGDHVLFLGQVERYAYQASEPLLYLNGKYAQAQALELAV